MDGKLAAATRHLRYGELNLLFAEETTTRSTREAVGRIWGGGIAQGQLGEGFREWGKREGFKITRFTAPAVGVMKERAGSEIKERSQVFVFFTSALLHHFDRVEFLKKKSKTVLPHVQGYRIHLPIRNSDHDVTAMRKVSVLSLVSFYSTCGTAKFEGYAVTPFLSFCCVRGEGESTVGMIRGSCLSLQMETRDAVWVPRGRRSSEKYFE